MNLMIHNEHKGFSEDVDSLNDHIAVKAKQCITMMILSLMY